jgi:hypothetical protein
MLVQLVELPEVLERHVRIARLASCLDGPVALLRGLAEEDVQVWVPRMLFVKIFISF